MVRRVKYVICAGVVFLVPMAMFAGNANAVRPVLLPERLAPGNVNIRPIQPIDSADWIWGADDAKVRLFRRRFTSGAETVRIHVSADNRYVLKLDGRRVARGPERGTLEHWTYRTLDLALGAGDHVLEAVVDRTGDTPRAQLEWPETGGFILKAEGSFDAELTTGTAPWKVLGFDNFKCAGARGGTFGIGPSNVIEGNSPWFADPPDSAFGDVRVVRERIVGNKYGAVRKGWRLYPTTLPQQLDEVKSPGAFRAVASDTDASHVYTEVEADPKRVAGYAKVLDGDPLVIPEKRTVNILWDLGDYYCGYPEVETSDGRGARIEFGWAESLVGPKGKGERDAFVGKRINPFNDVFRPDGGRDGFTTAWWRAGRWVRIVVKTGDEPVTIRRLSVAEVRYPTSYAATFESSDETLGPIQEICRRTLQMCSHEMSFDCPFYEQQMYPGDTRTQLLTHHVLSADDRLVRRDIELFDYSHRDDGRIAFNFPTTGTQDGASYTFMWPMMLADYAKWRTDAAWLRARFPGLVLTVEGFRNFETREGLVANLPGWNFQDWTAWPPGAYGDGCDPHADGTNAFNNALYIGMLKSAADVADALGEPGYANIWRERADRTSAAFVGRFWDEKRGMPAGDASHSFYSEHVLALALVFDVLPPEKAVRCAKALVDENDLVRCTVYFSHYLFEAYARIGRADLFLKRLDFWRSYLALHLKTVPESPGEPRSDCHAWGAHPLYHLHASVLGLKPSRPFFGAVRIAPQPAGLKFIRATTPTPKGDVVCDLAFTDGSVTGTVALPEGLVGEFVWKDDIFELKPGENKIDTCTR